MRPFITIGSSALALAAVTAGIALHTPRATLATTEAATAAAGGFTVDPVHSSVVFKIMHGGVASFYGRFNNPTGEFLIDPENLSASTISVSVKAENVDTANGGRDKHLMSADFFSAKEFPEITFKSSSFSKTGDKTFKVTGDLTLHGVTKEITADIIYYGQAQGRGGIKSGFDATFTIKRTDFGMDTYVKEGGLGDEVTLMIGIEGGQGG